MEKLAIVELLSIESIKALNLVERLPTIYRPVVRAHSPVAANLRSTASKSELLIKPFSFSFSGKTPRHSSAVPFPEEKFTTLTLRGKI